MAHSEEQLAPRVRDENLQLGQGLLLDVFGEPAIGDVSEFSDDHLSFVAERLLEVHAGFDRDSMDPHAVQDEADVILGVLAGVATEDIAEKLGTTPDDVTDRVRNISQVFVSHTSDQERAQLFAEIKQPPSQPKEEIAEAIGAVAVDDQLDQTTDTAASAESTEIRKMFVDTRRTSNPRSPRKATSDQSSTDGLSTPNEPTKSKRRTRNEKNEDYEDLVRSYLIEIGKFPLLAADDEVRLAQQIEAGKAAKQKLEDPNGHNPTEGRGLRRAAKHGDEAERTFTQSNLRLVVSIAKKYTSSGMPLLDLVQEGNLGLMHAVEKFDWRKGFKFSTYATWWIRQAITRDIANSSRTIRLPVHVHDTAIKLNKLRGEMELRHGRPATNAELAEESDIPVEKVMAVSRYTQDPVSLSLEIGESGDSELSDMVEDRNAESPLEAAARSLLTDEMAKMLAPLSERERIVLQLRFGFDGSGGRTLEEVAQHFSLTRERIRQIEAKAMTKLRHPTAYHGAREYLED